MDESNKMLFRVITTASAAALAICAIVAIELREQLLFGSALIGCALAFGFREVTK